MHVTILWVFDILIGKNSKRLGRKCVWSGSGVPEIFEKTKLSNNFANHIICWKSDANQFFVFQYRTSKCVGSTPDTIESNADFEGKQTDYSEGVLMCYWVKCQSVPH